MHDAYSLQMVVRSDRGRLRPHNEDSVFADSESGLAILADGMGGHNGGEIASGLAISLLSHAFPDVLRRCLQQNMASASPAVVQDEIRQEIASTNLSIFNTSKNVPQYAGMGTTLVLVWFFEDQLCVAHVGDSRLYRLRGEELKPLTHDHSVLQEQIDSGIISPADAHSSPIRNLVTRALGVAATVNVEFGEFGVRTGDLYLLCSDGLNDMLKDEDIRQILLSHPVNPDLAADELIEIANHLGGRDNVSVILIRVGSRSVIARH